MVNKLKRLPQAEQDLDDIWLHVALDNVAAADRLIDALWTAEHLLCEHPLVGRPRDDLGLGLRSWPVSGYLIIYRPDRAQTTIVRIIWGGRNLPELFRPSPP